MSGKAVHSHLEWLYRATNRFWSYVDRGEPDECWLWNGVKTKPTHCGLVYGIFTICDHGKTMTYRTHRFAYVLANGQIPDGLHICHSCDTPLCVNPRHLWAGTNKQNVHDRDKKGRVQQGSRHYMAKLDEEKVRIIKSSGASTKELADRFGVHYTTVLKVRMGERWKHVN